MFEHPECMLSSDYRAAYKKWNIHASCSNICTQQTARAIRQFRKRLASISAVKDGHAEHCLV